MCFTVSDAKTQHIDLDNLETPVSEELKLQYKNAFQ